MKKVFSSALIPLFVWILLTALSVDGIYGTGIASAAERKAKDVKVVLYMTDW